MPARDSPTTYGQAVGEEGKAAPVSDTEKWLKARVNPGGLFVRLLEAQNRSVKPVPQDRLNERAR